MFSTALHVLHFQTFMQDEEFSDELKDERGKWMSDDNHVIPESLNIIALKYGMYLKIKCLAQVVKLLSFG